MKSNKDACSPLNIFKQNQLSKQLATLTEEIKELKSDKNFLLSQLGCNTEKDVDRVEKNYKYNVDIADKLKARNVELQADYETEKSNYIEIKSNILPEDIEAIQAERIAIQTDGIRQTRIALENTYKEKFDDDIFAEAQSAVDNDLGEKPLRKSLVRQLQVKQQKSVAFKPKIHEPER